MNGYCNFLFIASVLASSSAFAAGDQHVLDLDQGTGSVEFHATGHPSALKIVGKGDKPHGSFVVNGHQVTGEARFSLATLVTGIDMRDKHMKEKYLEVEKYPEAKLTVSKLDLPQELVSGDTRSEVPFTGKLLLHGVERPVTGTAKIEHKGDHVSLDVQFGLKIADYGIALPSFAGITMADNVQISVLDTAPVSLAARGKKTTSE